MAVESVSANSGTSAQETARQVRERREERTRTEEQQRDRSPPAVEGKGERIDTSA